MSKDSIKKFYISTQREYSLILALAKEEDAAVIKIELTKDTGEAPIYKITLQGDENHLKFIEYLFKKKKEEMDKTIRITGVI